MHPFKNLITEGQNKKVGIRIQQIEICPSLIHHQRQKGGKRTQNIAGTQHLILDEGNPPIYKHLSETMLYCVAGGELLPCCSVAHLQHTANIPNIARVFTFVSSASNQSCCMDTTPLLSLVACATAQMLKMRREVPFKALRPAKGFGSHARNLHDQSAEIHTHRRLPYAGGHRTFHVSVQLRILHFVLSPGSWVVG